METTISAFYQDHHGDWVAALACEHTQHVRHDPPWQLREWVTSEEGRRGKLGQAMDCPLCDRLSMPTDAQKYQRTATFTEETLPKALRSAHRTKSGTWARIVVEEGELDYHVRGRVHRLVAGDAGLVEPERTHHVTPVGKVRLHVEFWRQSEGAEVS